MRTDCHRHLGEPANDVCGACAEAFCRDCLVYPFGPQQAPYCLGCATRAAGLRRGSGAAGRRGRKHRAMVEERRATLRAIRSAR